MSIFDVLTNGSLGSVLDSMTGGSAGRSSGFGGMGGLGSGIGSVLDSLGKTARSAASNIQKNTPGGLGGLAGAGALGALLGNVLQGDLMKSIAMAGAGAVAWNFYKKWAAQKTGEQAGAAQPAAQAAAASQSGDIPGFGDASHAASLPAKGLDPTAALVMRSMIYAARADGTIDATEQQRIDEILANMLPGQDLRAQMEAMRKETIDPAKIAKSVSSPEQAEDVYRLSCSVIDVDHFMETSYLQALATALGIDAAKKKQLEGEADEARRQLVAMVGQGA